MDVSFVIIAIQQPEHLPWLGFFDKMSKCDTYILLDNVQFKKRYFENRNKVRTKDGWHWIIVPVMLRGSLQIIKDVEINNSVDWKRKYLGTIRVNYSGTESYREYAPKLTEIIEKDWNMLVDLNIELINWTIGILDIKTRLIRASELGITDSRGSDLILEICKKVGAETYISGPDGRNYLKLQDFDREAIEVVYHDFVHPTYKQRYSPFISHMSIIDLIMNCNAESGYIVKNC